MFWDFSYYSYLHLQQVGIAYLLALENANSLTVSPIENIEYDRWVLLVFFLIGKEQLYVGSSLHLVYLMSD